MIVRQHLPVFLDAVALALLLGELAHLDLGIVPLDRFFEENIAGVFCREGNRRKQEGDGNQRFGLHRTLRLSAVYCQTMRIEACSFALAQAAAPSGRHDLAFDGSSASSSSCSSSCFRLQRRQSALNYHRLIDCDFIRRFLHYSFFRFLQLRNEHDHHTFAPTNLPLASSWL